MKIFNITVLTLVIGVNILFISCKKQSYEAIPEFVEIINNSDYYLHVEFDSTYFYIPYYYEFSEQNGFDSIPPGERVGTAITYNNYNLIMPDSMFSRIISTMRIFRTNKADTIYINPQNYNRRSVWKSTAGVYIFEAWEESACETLTVTNLMFNN